MKGNRPHSKFQIKYMNENIIMILVIFSKFSAISQYFLTISIWIFSVRVLVNLCENGGGRGVHKRLNSLFASYFSKKDD